MSSNILVKPQLKVVGSMAEVHSAILRVAWKGLDEISTHNESATEGILELSWKNLASQFDLESNRNHLRTRPYMPRLISSQVIRTRRAFQFHDQIEIMKLSFRMPSNRQLSSCMFYQLLE